MVNKILVFSLLLISVLFYNCDKGDETGNNNPTLPVLYIQDFSQAEGDDNNQLIVNVTLEGTNETNVIVDYATIAGTSTEEVDYLSVSDGQLIFGPNETSKPISITIKGDENDEPDETFEIKLLSPSNATIGRASATITILNDDTPSTTGLDIPTTGYTTPNSYAGMSLTWSDEFQANTLNTDDWNYEIGNGNNGWGNNELQYYRQENTYIHDNEYLVIEAKEENFGGSAYTSSRLTTQDKQEFKYGRIDIRAALPETQGIWPALWMLGENFGTSGWPSCGEIDIMELLGQTNNKVHGTIHYGASVQLWDFVGSSYSLSGGNNFNNEFHVFSIIWEEDSIKWLVDDTQFFSINPSSVNGQPYPFNNEFFFIFNVAVGGDWPGSPDQTTVFSQYMIVDYVRVFQ